MKGILGAFARDQKYFSEIEKKLEAVNRTQAIIEFTPQGEILSANKNFTDLMEYHESELIGQHHSIFVEPQYKSSNEYNQFWQDLGSGKNFSGEYKRVTKTGGEVWIHGSYNALLDDTGKPYKVVKFASDITDNKRQADQASALKLCQANVMLADNELNIVYLNDTVTEMLTANEFKLREDLPKFSVDSLLGSNVNIFESNSNPQWERLKTLESPYETEIQISNLIFGLIATPWYGLGGERLGTLIEWEDRTEELARLQAERRLADDNLRVKQALDFCNTSVILADKNMDIIYANESIKRMLKYRELTIKQSIPSFSSEKIVGDNINIFSPVFQNISNILSSLSSTQNYDLEIESLTFGLTVIPIFSDAGERIGTVIEWLDKTDQLAKEAEEKKVIETNTRVRQALDNVSANVMIADADANIIYVNQTAHDMMSDVERDIRKDIPNFNAKKLVGTNIDDFHKNPSHQRNLLKNLKDTYVGKAEAGGRHFTVIANPVFNDGKRVGTVVEWDDKTAEIAIEKEIDDMIAYAAGGDFSKQLTLDRKKGFFLSLSKGLNELVGTVEIALNDVVRVVGAMAKGDLSERITRDYEGAFGSLKQDVNATADKLTEVLTQIRLTANSITSSAKEISQGNADLSQRTEEQASSLEETASSMEEMTATVKASSDNAEEASQLAFDAQDVAQSGGHVVENAVKAMEEINGASKKISDIIGVIDEIAFQTNLLALNAAVEAARAGEQGRGFAVVAGEVRNLAQRSAAAAKEIKLLIKDSVQKVEDGSEHVNQSGKTLREIVTSIEGVSKMMSTIAEASREQTSGIEQVNTAISQMDEMTQQNAALVEQASAAGESMADQAVNLSKVIEFFSVGETASVSIDSAKPKIPSVKPIPSIVPAQVEAPKPAVNTSPVEKSTAAPEPVTSSISSSESHYDDEEWEEF